MLSVTHMKDLMTIYLESRLEDDYDKTFGHWQAQKKQRRTFNGAMQKSAEMQWYIHVV